jgi:hypothetical protein
MNTIKELLVNGGYVTSKIHRELEKDFSKLEVCIKWGCARRQLVKLGELRSKFKEGESRGDYVREVFVPVDTLGKLQEGFGITDSDVSEYYHTLRV